LTSCWDGETLEGEKIHLKQEAALTEKSRSRFQPIQLGTFFAVACCVAVAAGYLTNLVSGPFLDDFGWVRMAMSSIERGWLSLWGDAFQCPFFRPLNVGLLVLSIRLDSWALTHGTVLLVHLAVSILTAWLANKVLHIKKSPWLMVMVGCAVFVHQANVTAILQLDTASQAMSGLFSLLAIVTAFKYAQTPSSGTRWLLAGGIASLLAMLGKEGGISVPFAALITVAFFARAAMRLPKLIRASFVQAASLLTYVIWRRAIAGIIPPPGFHQTRYGFKAGAETVGNLAHFVFVETVPWNSASLIFNKRLGEWLAALGLGIVIVGVTALGWKLLIRSPSQCGRAPRRVLLWLLLVFLVWCTPYVFLVRVSEQYVYRLTTVATIIVSIGCWQAMQHFNRRLALLALITWCSWLGVNSVSSLQKTALLKQNAKISQATLESMAEKLGDLSMVDEIWILLYPSRPPPRRYSILYVPKWIVRARTPLGLQWYLDKPDLKVVVFWPKDTVPVYEGTPESLRKLTVDVMTGSVSVLSTTE